MEKQAAIILSTTLGVLAVAGLMKKDKHLMRLMNVDTTHSMIRLPLAATLALGALGKMKYTRFVLSASSVLYLLIGLLGIKDKRLAGLLPSELTRFDLFYHFAVGLPTLWLGIRKGKMLKP